MPLVERGLRFGGYWEFRVAFEGSGDRGFLQGGPNLFVSLQTSRLDMANAKEVTACTAGHNPTPQNPHRCTLNPNPTH